MKIIAINVTLIRLKMAFDNRKKVQNRTTLSLMEKSRFDDYGNEEGHILLVSPLNINLISLEECRNKR